LYVVNPSRGGEEGRLELGSASPLSGSHDKPVGAVAHAALKSQMPTLLSPMSDPGHSAPRLSRKQV
jgi:hypothetical protein